jgi:hypothetical protein
MEWLSDIASQCGWFCTPYLHEIATALVTCFLVVMGNDINRNIRKRIKHLPFLLRTAVFVLVTAFGYGMMVILLSPMIAGQMARLPAQWLIPILTASFILLGMLAERNRLM